MDEYKTIEKRASDEFTVKRSRFIGHICPVTTQEQAVDFINEIKSKYWDATHNVYAYVLREGQSSRYSDDGEPQGTAGMPTLNVLIKEGLTDCAVVVTRYFGGIMLGAGGLVRAYSQGSKIAVDAGGIITMAKCAILTVDCDYNFYGRLSSLIPESGGIILDTAFSDGVAVKMRIPLDLRGQFDAKLVDLSLGKFSSELINEEFAPINR
ncbi:MAG: YigZ family protein [Clostridiales bacterium]|nr:YigZ family protein [Clostridiales bacterium]